MALADRPQHIDVRMGSTLRRRQRRRRPYRAAAKAAAQVLIFAVAMVVMWQQGAGSMAPTLFFGVASLIYLMADFVLELPDPG
jgi:hypothetical protein